MDAALTENPFSLSRSCKLSLSLYKRRLSLYKRSLCFYKLSLSLENLPMQNGNADNGGSEIILVRFRFRMPLVAACDGDGRILFHRKADKMLDVDDMFCLYACYWNYYL